MPLPTKAELQSKFDDLQQDYKTKLDDIFDRLYKRLEEIESLTPSAPVMPPTPSAAQAAPRAPETSQAPQAPIPASVSPSSRKVPRWRDTWTYQGLKGLASRVWRGTNPQDIAWKYANEQEGLLPHLTLQEYLDLRESANEFVDYYFVIEEAVSPEIGKAFANARDEVSKLVLNFLKQAHDLGVKIGDLAATTRYMYPPKQQFLFDKGSPEKKDEVMPTEEKPEKAILPQKVAQPELAGKEKVAKEKKVELPIIENPAQKKSDILGNMMDKIRREDLEPFNPWTWFAWAKKPSGIYKKAIPDATEALLKQWQDQAGKKFTNELEGLTNMFVAFSKGWFGDIDYTNNKLVATKISNLMGKEVKGRPWSDFVKNFENENSAEIYLDTQGASKPSRFSQAKPNTPEAPPLEKAASSIEDYTDDRGSYSD